MTIVNLIFFRKSGLDGWAIYGLQNLFTHFTASAYIKKVVMTILTNKQSGSRLDELGERKDAHGLGKIGCQGPVVYEFAVINFV